MFESSFFLQECLCMRNLTSWKQKIVSNNLFFIDLILWLICQGILGARNFYFFSKKRPYCWTFWNFFSPMFSAKKSRYYRNKKIPLHHWKRNIVLLLHIGKIPWEHYQSSFWPFDPFVKGLWKKWFKQKSFLLRYIFTL